MRRVSPLLGTGATDLPQPQGLAATWLFHKAQAGNNHPHAALPAQLVTVGPYSGAYPTGYGTNALNYNRLPRQLADHPNACAISHLHPSGTGEIGVFHNHIQVSPIQGDLAEFGQSWPLLDEVAEPGRYAARLGSGVRFELTVAPFVAIHRYQFAAPGNQNQLVIDLTSHGLLCDNLGPLQGDLEALTLASPHRVDATLRCHGLRYFVSLECDDAGTLAQWHGHPKPGAGAAADGVGRSGITFGKFSSRVVNLRVAFSFRSHEDAQQKLRDVEAPFEDVAAKASDIWAGRLSAVTIDTDDQDLSVKFDTALYRCLLKPVDLTGQSPWWQGDSPCVADVATLWDQYKTLVPLLCTFWPDLAANVINGLLEWTERRGGMFPNGIILEEGPDRFAQQARGLACLSIYDAFLRNVPNVDYDQALRLMAANFDTEAGQEFCQQGRCPHPTHTLDFAQAAYATAALAEALGDRQTAARLEPLAANWRNAYDPATGLLLSGQYYEGSKWNYSFRLQHAISERIALAGGPEAFVRLLDRFFGYDQPPLARPTLETSKDELNRQLALGRFEGLNNEPDMETMHAYRWAGRPDRTEAILDAVFQYQFATGRGGLPGNDDSGGLSSWFVWNTLGLFPVAGQDVLLRGRLRVKKATLRLPGDCVITLPLAPSARSELTANSLVPAAISSV